MVINSQIKDLLVVGFWLAKDERKRRKQADILKKGRESAVKKRKKERKKKEKEKERKGKERKKIKFVFLFYFYIFGFLHFGN